MYQNQNEGPITSSTPNKGVSLVCEQSSPALGPQIVLESGKVQIYSCAAVYGNKWNYLYANTIVGNN